MSQSTYTVINEPILGYVSGSVERNSLKTKLEQMASEKIEIPIIINGKEIFTGDTGDCRMPHDHQHILGTYHKAGNREVQLAIDTSMEAWKFWSKSPLDERIALFQRTADLLAGPWRDTINSATMLNQSKNVFQAEIDAVCEFVDFLRFNAYFAEGICSSQPLISPEGMHNHLEYRPLEGFIFAATPFNFTSIAGNLPSAPVLMGNVAIWKPASSAVYSAYYLMKLFQEAGLPDGVINFLPGSGGKVGDPVMDSEHLAGVHFTGSTEVFQGMWKKVGKNISNYKTYPRIVGETGGKDFILAHDSADVGVLATACVRGAFEYQGQKCSAASRGYIPRSIWNDFKEKYIAQVNTIKMGDVRDFNNFMNAVIDEASFDNIANYIDYSKNSEECEIITNGGYDKSKGYFVEPTTIVTTNPHFKSMVEEIFGPVLTLYVYDDSWENICKIVDSTSPYALTGAILGSDKDAIKTGTELLTHSAGNFYINDKPTGAVVGQQPFGGSRASGTNDKAGSPLNLLRWVSQRTIKETFDPPKDYKYPFMTEE